MTDISGGAKIGYPEREGRVITKEMKIEEVLRTYPQTIPAFSKFGIDCAGCQLSEFENIEHGAKVHGIDLEALLKALNESLVRK